MPCQGSAWGPLFQVKRSKGASRRARRARAAKTPLTRETQSRPGCVTCHEPWRAGREGCEPQTRQGNVQVTCPVSSVKAATDDSSSLRLQLTDEPLTSSVHTPPPMQAHFTLTDINVRGLARHVRKTDPQNPKLPSVRCQPSQSTLGLSTGLLSSGSLAWARPGGAACSLPSTPPAPGSLGGGGGGLLGPCLA